VKVGDEYKSIRPKKNSLVVNLGDLFSKMTNYRLKATLHRVLDIKVSRYSSPFFLEPYYNAKIPEQLIFKDGEKREEKEEMKVYGEWLIDKACAKYGEFATFIEAARK